MRPSGEIGLHEKRVELFTKRVADLRLSESWNVIYAAFQDDPMVVVKTKKNEETLGRQSLGFHGDLGDVGGCRFLVLYRKPTWTRATLGTPGSRLEWTFCRCLAFAQRGRRITDTVAFLTDLCLGGPPPWQARQNATYTKVVGQIENVKRMWRRRMKMTLTKIRCCRRRRSGVSATSDSRCKKPGQARQAPLFRVASIRSSNQ